MKYTTEVIIDRPRADVIAKFEDPESMKAWQPTLQRYETLSGAPGQPGSTMKLVYDEGGRTMEMVETIVANELPNEFHATYETVGVYNMQKNWFTEMEDGKTRWLSESEFKFSGLMILMGIFMRGAFPKQTLQTMQNFKAFVEAN